MKKSPFEIQDLIAEARDNFYAFAEYEFPRARIDRTYNWFWAHEEPIPFDYTCEMNCIFLPWYLYSFKDQYSRIIAYEYVPNSDIEKQWIRSCISNPFSFYEVQKKTFPHYLELKDLITGRKTRVMDALAYRTYEPQDVLFAKLTIVEGYTFFESIYREKLDQKQIPNLKLLKKESEMKRLDVFFSVIGRMFDETENMKSLRPILTLVQNN